MNSKMACESDVYLPVAEESVENLLMAVESEYKLLMAGKSEDLYNWQRNLKKISYWMWILNMNS